MKPGIYALISLDGAPLQPDDLRLLGLPQDGQHARICAPGCVVAVLDREVPATHVVQTQGEITAFAGYLDESDDLAGALGLDPSTSPALLAREGLQHYAAAAAEHMLGAWTMLCWNGPARQLTLLGGERMRDALYFVTNGSYAAVAPDMFVLCSLPWVGRTLDPEGFALNVARAGLRKITGDSTPWKGVHAVRPGVREVVNASGRTSLRPAEAAPFALFQGDFDDAVEASTAICRRIVAQEMRRSGSNAFLLSGGIDSGLLASLGAQETGPGAEMFCLTSIAPEGSGVADEWEFSSEVATQLAVDHYAVAPESGAGPYRPSETFLAHVQQPSVGMRHYLYDALYASASARGAHAVFDGVAGELSITHKPALGSYLWWLRRWRFQSILWWEERKAKGVWPEGAFHVRLAPELLAALPKEWKEAWRQGPAIPPKRVAGIPVGMHPAVKKDIGAGSSVPFGLRVCTPYLDRRLLRLAATFPAEMFEHQGETRAIARAMLRGRVPEQIRTRRSGLPISPDYRERARQLAAIARERIPQLAAEGAGKWVDLDWLDEGLKQTQTGTASVFTETSCQLSAGAAEFVSWLNR